MILVTGGTGFIGQTLTRHLVSIGKQVRILIRPSRKSPKLPVGIPVEVAVCSIDDERGLVAAMKGIDTIFHLIGTERLSTRADLSGVDIEGTKMIVHAARQANVKRIFYLSHLGADRSSAFALFKAKAIAENHIIHSGIEYTIFRTGPIFGPNDQFTVPLVKFLKLLPGIFLMPGDGNTLIQPLFIEDLIVCLSLSIDLRETKNQLYSIGGAEYLKYQQVVELIMAAKNINKKIIPFPSQYLRIASVIFEQFIPRFPISIFWLDYLISNRTTTLDVLPKVFGLIPSRFANHLDYL